MSIKTNSKITTGIDVLILCGGAGSRLRSLISDRPKGMALIGGRPFLDILVEDLLKQGFQRIIFCVGHLSKLLNVLNLVTTQSFVFRGKYSSWNWWSNSNALSMVKAILS